MQEKISTKKYNGKEYVLFYDAANGDHSLQKVGPQFITVFENGTMTKAGEEEFSSGSAEVVKDIKSDIATAFKNSGGTSNASVNPYPEAEVTTTGTSVLDVIKDNVTTGISSITSTIQDFTSEWSIDKELLKNKFSNITEHTIKELMRRGPLNYPQDALYSNRQSGFNQDHVRITQYTYRPPRGNTFTGGGKENFGVKEFTNIVTEGLQRTTPLEKYLGMVKLPMPTDISDSNNVNWGSDSMNNLSAAMTAGVMNNLGGAALGAAAGSLKGFAGLGAIAGILGEQQLKGNLNLDTKEGWQDLGNKLKGVYKGAGGVLLNSTLSSKVLSSAGVQVSPEAILARGYGVIPNANMELLFQSPALRSFSFNWKMTPRDEDEARIIKNIIRFFKQGMAARKMDGSAGDSSVYLGTPNVFHVQYKTNQDQNMEGLNRIKTCACTGCSINYTPDGVWSAYEEGQPVSTIMALRFQELEPIYDTDYQNKIVEGRVFNENPTYTDDQGDLYPIGINEVGY
tara:strand:+ start:980 stop:2512 length:1533 start_codon:yes stop_codon:yes gene_type:complete